MNKTFLGYPPTRIIENIIKKHQPVEKEIPEEGYTIPAEVISPEIATVTIKTADESDELSFEVEKKQKLMR